jgi:AcrR family transcriptional regulator
MSERQEGPEERASGGATGTEASSGEAEQGVSGGVGGSEALSGVGGLEAASGGATQETGGAGLGQQNVGQAGPDMVQGALQTEQELRDRGQELRDLGREMREIGRERARELRELARAQREAAREQAREQARELRELVRAQRAMARGLRGPGRGRTGAGMAGAGTALAGTALAGAPGPGTAGGTWGGWGAGGAGSAGSDGRATGDERSTRERILDVALDIFIEQGYDKASLREIAERMGFTKAALYYHFPSKADMLMALHLRMHNIIDEPISLLGDGAVSVETWERFLDACINTLKGNQKLFEMHRINQAAMAGVHSEGHEGAHQELEEQAMRIFSEPSLRPEDRLRMAAAFAVSFITPFLTSGLFSDAGDDFLANGLREIVHRVLQPEAANREVANRELANRDEETSSAADKPDH